MKKSGYLMRARAMEIERRSVHTQMCLDAAMIAANEIFNMGPTRCEAFAAAYSEALNAIAGMTVEDGRTDRDLWFSKRKLDERLQQICGEKFQPWEVRYASWR